MSVTAPAPLEGALHTTNAWLNELADELGWEDQHQVLRALRTVLHALRDRLPLAEVADLGAQLPTLIRGFYYEGWNPSHKLGPGQPREVFLADIAPAVAGNPFASPERVVRCVVKVLERHVSSGELGDVKHVLPAGVRALLP